VLEWLGRTSGPFFAWVHFYDPHAPYAPPPPYRETFAGRPYDGEVAFADAQLGRILDALRAAGRGMRPGQHGGRDHESERLRKGRHDSQRVAGVGDPAQSIADVIRTAQADEGKLTCATAGNGTGMHLAFELFVAMAKAKIQHVPYRGSPQGITDLLAKRIDFQMDTPTVLLPFIKDGRLRAIAVTGSQRFFAVPDVPTIAEAGVPGYVVTSWLGVAGPAGLPAPFVNRVNAEITAILAEPAVIERLREFGSETMPTTPDGFKARVAEDVAKWTKVVADANIPRV